MIVSLLLHWNKGEILQLNNLRMRFSHFQLMEISSLLRMNFIIDKYVKRDINCSKFYQNWL